MPACGLFPRRCCYQPESAGMEVKHICHNTRRRLSGTRRQTRAATRYLLLWLWFHLGFFLLQGLFVFWPHLFLQHIAKDYCKKNLVQTYYYFECDFSPPFFFISCEMISISTRGMECVHLLHSSYTFRKSYKHMMPWEDILNITKFQKFLHLSPHHP